ncbi:hypothetical protein L228DRAFT_280081 [Xylona heveae TC161]|uniref:BZIP domain-containing protein n=1 Tax=Xylona heveae (strain CBS 132557 / TC161) TaxID=1328760 RepID=A0A165K3C0_XYLHT|nr:hypothetical protein L228DRAFT_280081 [Xylona heveae TC161]KZF26940.1 hypothetical protein L228DRAFT_280081 [Xylona heveae TC161]
MKKATTNPDITEQRRHQNREAQRRYRERHRQRKSSYSESIPIVELVENLPNSEHDVQAKENGTSALPHLAAGSGSPPGIEASTLSNQSDKNANECDWNDMDDNELLTSLFKDASSPFTGLGKWPSGSNQEVNGDSLSCQSHQIRESEIGSPAPSLSASPVQSKQSEGSQDRDSRHSIESQERRGKSSRHGRLSTLRVKAIETGQMAENCTQGYNSHSRYGLQDCNMEDSLMDQSWNVQTPGQCSCSKLADELGSGTIDYQYKDNMCTRPQYVKRTVSTSTIPDNKSTVLKADEMAKELRLLYIFGVRIGFFPNDPSMIRLLIVLENRFRALSMAKAKLDCP